MSLRMELFWRLPTGLLLLGLAGRCTAIADASNYFLWPPPANGSSPTNGGEYANDIVLAPGTNLSIEYSTNYTSYTIDLYQHVGPKTPNDDYLFLKTILNHDPGTADSSIETPTTENHTVWWTVDTYIASPLNGSTFYFWIQDANDPKQLTWFMSHYFNISGPDANGTVSSGPLSSSNSSAASDASPSSISITSGGDTNASSSTNSNVETIALGVGLGVGIPIVLLLAAGLALRIRRERRKDKNVTDSVASLYDSSNRGSSSRNIAFPQEKDTPFSQEKDAPKAQIHEVPDHAVHETTGVPVHEVPDHAVVEAPGHSEPKKAETTPVEPVELPSTRRYSWD